MSTPRNYVPVHVSGITVTVLHVYFTYCTVQISYQYSTLGYSTVYESTGVGT